MEKTRPRVRAVARAGMAALRQAGGGVEKAHDRHHSMACSVGRNWLGWLVRSAQSRTHHTTAERLFVKNMYTSREFASELALGAHPFGCWWTTGWLG